MAFTRGKLTPRSLPRFVRADVVRRIYERGYLDVAYLSGTCILENYISRAATHAYGVSFRLFPYILLASWQGLFGVLAGISGIMAGFIWCSGMDCSGMWQGLLAWMVTRDARGAYRSWKQGTRELGER
jgi:hypothetical protein